MLSWMRRLVAVGVLAAGCAAAGCGNPCVTLADRTCEKVGEETPLCTKARQHADNAGPSERSNCARAMELVEAAVKE